MVGKGKSLFLKPIIVKSWIWCCSILFRDFAGGFFGQMSFDVPMFAFISCSIDFMDFWWTCSWIVDIFYRSSSKTTEGGRCIHLCLLAATGSKCWSKCEFIPHGFQHELFVMADLTQVPQIITLFPYYQEVKIYCH